MRATKSVEATAATGVISTRMTSHILTGSVLAPTPARKIEMTTSSKEVMNANTAPPTTPGRIRGKVTVRNACQGEAPSPSAARGSIGSSPWRDTPTFSTTNGSAISAWPIAIPSVVPTRPGPLAHVVEGDARHHDRDDQGRQDEPGEHLPEAPAEPLQAEGRQRRRGRAPAPS